MRFRLDREGDKRRVFYTVLILPHSQSRFRKIHVSRGFVLGVVAAILLLGSAGLVLPHLYFSLQNRSGAAARLAGENEDLREENERFENRLAEISERLGRYEEQTGRLAEALGLEELPTLEPAGGAAPAGSASPDTMLDTELSALDTRSSQLSTSLDQLDEAFQARARLLGSTPSVMPLEGWFSHGFGWRKDPFTGRRQFHRGIDIVNHAGTPVVATAAGVISRARRDGELGKTIDVSHGAGFVTRYAHLNEILVKPGQEVSRGELIGKVGSTGRSTGPHLHYEVFRDGRRVNPWKYLGQRGS